MLMKDKRPVNKFLIILLSFCIVSTFPLLPQESSYTAIVYAAAKGAAVKSIKLNHKTYTLKKGKKVTLKATIKPKKASGRKILWKSSNTKIAAVSKKGVVKAGNKTGKVTITATVKGTKKKAKCTVYVTNGKLGKLSKKVLYGKPIALMNDYGAFLSVDKDNETLILSDKPYMWRLEKGKNGSHIVSDKKRKLMFDLNNAWYEAGNKVHLYEDTGYECQFWNLTARGDGFIITSAEKPAWCVASAEKGFTLQKKSKAGKNDTWKIIKGGRWADVYVSSAKYPFYHWKGVSFTPTPEFWNKFDDAGITADMRAEDVDAEDIYAQYAIVEPYNNSPHDKFDFFSVDFYTPSQPDATYWSLANWYMDCREYRKRHGYTGEYTDGAYAGFQNTDNRTKKIMSMWETYFTKADGSQFTLVPECVYPKDEATSFDNEGSGTSLIAPFKWKPNTWYRFVLRSWTKGNTTYVGTWAEDLSSGKVSLLAVYNTFLPKSFMKGVPFQFLENFGSGTHSEYRQMKLKNYRLHTIDTDEWIYLENADMSIWATSEVEHRGTYRFSAKERTLTVETCGIGKDVCRGMDDKETVFRVRMRPAYSRLKMSKYKIPSL